MNAIYITLYLVLMALTPLLGDSAGEDDLSAVTGESSRIEAVRTQQIEAYQLAADREEEIKKAKHESLIESGISKSINNAIADLRPGLATPRPLWQLEQTLYVLERAYKERYREILTDELRERGKQFAQRGALLRQKDHLEKSLSFWRRGVNPADGVAINEEHNLKVLLSIKASLEKVNTELDQTPFSALTGKEMNALNTEALLYGGTLLSGFDTSLSGGYRNFVHQTMSDFYLKRRKQTRSE